MMTPLCAKLVPSPVSILRSSWLIAVCVAPIWLSAQTTIDTTKLEDEAVQRTTEYIRLNTTNPPGNEVQTMRFLARILQQEGIPFDTASSAPGRGNIWARLKGGPKPALVLLHHMDVVPADPKYWDADPFAATVKNGEIYGRGTLDTKTLGIVELEAFLALHRSHTPLDRDVIFMATADEEAGGVFGAQWVVQHHPEAFRGAGFLINEGSMGSVDGTRQSFAIEVTQKTPFWLKLTTTGKAGHGSTPPPASAVNRLIRALYRLQTYDFAPRVVSAVATYFAAIAPTASPKWKDVLTNPATLTTDHNALAEFQIDLPELAALVRNTCSITGLQGSNKINVVPPEASALVDCRLLPDQDHEAFLREFTGVLNDRLHAGRDRDQHAALRRDRRRRPSPLPRREHRAVRRDRIYRQPLVPRPRHRELRLCAVHGARSRTVRGAWKQRTLVSGEHPPRHTNDARDRQPRGERIELERCRRDRIHVRSDAAGRCASLEEPIS